MGGITTTLFQRPRDPQFNNTTLLLSGNFPTNGAQNNTFLDSSNNGFSITRNGNTTQGSFSPFSQTGWSNYFNGATTSGPLLYASYSTTNFDWFTSGQDFTLECWVYPVDLATFSYVDGASTVPRMTGNNDQNGTSNYWTFGPISDGKVRLHYFNGAVVQVTSTATVTANTWNHIAFTKTSSGITIFVNGTATTATAISGTPQSSATYPLTIGRGNSGSINGYVSNYRILKNVTPPYSGTYTVPTAPLTDISGTKILTAQANRFVDSSAAANVMTVTGSTVSVQAFSPFVPSGAYTTTAVGGSGYFDGTGDYLSIANQTALQFGTGDFCYETWIYPTNLQANKAAGERCTIDTGSSGFLISLWNENVHLASYGVADLADFASTGIANNTWAHLAITRSGTSVRCFVNGTQAGSTTTLSTNFSSSGSTFIGQFNNSTSLFQGYMCGTRLVKGSAVYTSNFTCPTAPPTAITNTQLLLNFTNAGIVDSTAKNVLETVDNAQISTTQSKFGGSSMYFDGTGDAILVSNSSASPNFEFQGDFTIELWMYIAGGSGNRRDIIHYDDGTNGLGIFLQTTNVLWAGVVTYSASSFTPSLNTWYHVALVRSGTATNNCKLYVDGTQYLQFTNTTAINPNATMSIGRTSTGANDLNGYIDDLRITKGVARYTANFNVPTIGFTDR